MQAADRVIAVSELTRRIVIGKYGILADKVVTVATKSAPFSSACNHPPMRAKKCCVPTDSCSIKS